MARMSRNKGARGERELSKKITEIFGCKARRGRQFCGSPDSPDVQTDLPVHIECKYVERLNAYDALEQSIRDSGDKIPVVCHRRNRKDWMLMMRLEDAPEFVRQIAAFMEEPPPAY